MPPFLSYIVIGLIGLLSFALEPVYAAGTEDEVVETEGNSEYETAKTLIKSKQDFAAALPILESLTQEQPDYADAWNLRGFANRKLGNLDAAAEAYSEALRLNPEHLGALEYQGEMFVEMGQLDLAQKLCIHDTRRFSEECLPWLVEHLTICRPAHGEKLLIGNKVVQVAECLVGRVPGRGDFQDIAADALQYTSLLAEALERGMRVIAVVKLVKDS